MIFECARHGSHWRCTPALAFLTVLLLASTVWAARSEELCNLAAKRAADATGIPENVLLAIALAESGRRKGNGLSPWPWTVNAGGKGHWFDTRGEALNFVKARRALGDRNLDLGCFQINYRWHGVAFASIEAMFDPWAGALYAARFLKDLHQETGDWVAAAGAYHSRTEIHASRYRTRFRKILTTLDVSGADPPLAPATSHWRSGAAEVGSPLPLPAVGRISRFGSLVPLTRAASPLVEGLGR